MQVILAAIAAAASVVGLAYANLARRHAQRPCPRRELAEAGLGRLALFIGFWVVLLFLLALPNVRPFSPGLTLGWGLLIGAACGLYALYEAANGADAEFWTAPAVGLLSVAVLGPSAVLLIFRGYPNEALMGCALGAVLVAAITSGVARPLYAAAPAQQRGALGLYRGLEVFAIATAAVAVTARLGIERFPRPAPDATAGGYWSLPAVMLAAGALALILFSEDWSARLGRWRGLAIGATASAAMVILAAVLQPRLFPNVAWQVPLYGLLAFGFVLAVLLRDSEEAGEEHTRPVALAFGAALLALVLTAVVFRTLQGYGQGLALLAALPIAAGACLGRERSREPLAESLALGGVTIVALLTLYRLFLERASRGWALDFQSHYDYMALLLGAAACFGLMAFASRGMDRARAAREAGRPPVPALMIRITWLGLALIAAPLALAAVWGIKAVGAFVAGLAIGEAAWMMLAACVTGSERERMLAAGPHIFIIGSALVGVQLAPAVLAIEWSLPGKLAIVGAMTMAAVVWIAAEALGHAPRKQGEAGDETVT